MTDTSKILSETAGNDVVFTRIIDAPRELVFKAWTEPKLLARWWGPKDFTNPVCELDLRPGGAWRIVMRGPDGAEYPIKGTYREIVPPERLVYIDDWDQEEKPTQPMLITVTFAEQEGKTKLTILTQFASATDRDTTLKMGAVEGWAQSLDRLEALVETFEGRAGSV